MKNKLVTVAILLTVGLTLAANALAQQTPAAPLVLKTQKEKASYTIGTSIAKTLQHDGIDVDAAILARGLSDALGGGKLLLSDDELKAVFTAIQKDVTERQKEAHEKQEAEMKAFGEANQKEGAEFLATNKTKEGVVTLPSGLQYKIEKQGDGPKPRSTDTVVCNYRGTLINGKEFDSSYKSGPPATIPVTGVIKGWTEILQLMPAGSKYQVFIPADLAYGPRPSPEIGPNATLIFEIELLSIQARTAAAPAAAPNGAKPAEPAK
jgi:FKBP-type peptidyl-prolyl cis-trans isomerase FklB